MGIPEVWFWTAVGIVSLFVLGFIFGRTTAPDLSQYKAADAFIKFCSKHPGEWFALQPEYPVYGIRCPK